MSLELETNYRGYFIPATAAFKVAWWMFLVLVILTTIAAVGLLLFHLVTVARTVETFQQFTQKGLPYVASAVIILALLLIPEWFAVMWSDWGCMVASLVIAILMLISLLVCLAMYCWHVHFFYDQTLIKWTAIILLIRYLVVF